MGRPGLAAVFSSSESVPWTGAMITDIDLEAAHTDSIADNSGCSCPRALSALKSLKMLALDILHDADGRRLGRRPRSDAADRCMTQNRVERCDVLPLAIQNVSASTYDYIRHYGISHSL